MPDRELTELTTERRAQPAYQRLCAKTCPECAAGRGKSYMIHDEHLNDLGLMDGGPPCTAPTIEQLAEALEVAREALSAMRGSPSYSVLRDAGFAEFAEQRIDRALRGEK